MPGMDGIELVKKIRATEDAAAVVVMTAFGAVSSAIDAMRAGAAEYLTKPLNFDELLVVLDKVFETQDLRREARQLRARVRDRVAPSNIVGKSRDRAHQRRKWHRQGARRERDPSTLASRERTICKVALRCTGRVVAGE